MEFKDVPKSRKNDAQTQRRKAIKIAAFVSIGICAVLIGSNFDPKVRDKQIEAFGANPLGMPTILLVVLVETLLFLPVPWIVWYWVRVAFQAAQDGKKPGYFYLLSVGSIHPHLRSSQRICILGMAYVLTIFCAWISFTVVRGI